MVRTARFTWNADDEPELADLSELGDGRHDLDALDDPLFDEPISRRSKKPSRRTSGEARGNRRHRPSSGPPPAGKQNPALRHLAAADWLAPRTTRDPRRHRR